MQTAINSNWTVEAGAKAAERGYFIQVPDGHKLLLSGAPKIWSRPETQNYHYHTEYRIAGNPDDILSSLRQAGIAQFMLTNILQNSITRNNYQTTMKSVFDRIIANDQNQRERLTNETKNGIDQLVINILDGYILDAVSHIQNTGENVLIRRAYRKTLRELENLQEEIRNDIISRYQPDEDDEYEED